MIIPLTWVLYQGKADGRDDARVGDLVRLDGLAEAGRVEARHDDDGTSAQDLRHQNLHCTWQAALNSRST